MPAERVGSSPGGQGKTVPVEETAVQHDESMAVTAAVTPIRIVCANTLNPDVRIERVISTRLVIPMSGSYASGPLVMGAARSA